MSSILFQRPTGPWIPLHPCQLHISPHARLSAKSTSLAAFVSNICIKPSANIAARAQKCDRRFATCHTLGWVSVCVCVTYAHAHSHTNLVYEESVSLTGGGFQRARIKPITSCLCQEFCKLAIPRRTALMK